MVKINSIMLSVSLLFTQVASAGSAQTQESLLPIEQVEVFAKQVEHYAAAQGALSLIHI